MKKIAIVNNKGGCGKTTTVFNLAYYFAKKKLKTLVIDTDPQLNLTSIIGLNVNQLQSSLGDYLLNRLNTFKPEVINENFHLLSAGLDAESDMELLKSQGVYYYQRLNDFFETLSNYYDVVLIDTAPAFNAYTTSSIYAASVYSIVLPGIIELYGLDATMEYTNELGKDISGVILTRQEKTSLSEQIYDQLKTDYNDYLLKTIIRKNVALSECIITHQSIFDYSKRSNGANDYKKLAEEIMKREGIT